MVAVEINNDGVDFDPLVHVNVHPAADLFPLMRGQEFADLVEDIRQNGLREPVVFTPDGQMLDGRNRYRACKKIGDEPPRRTEHSEPWAYVISTNVHRRHLSETQRSMIAAKIAERRHGKRGPGKDAPIGVSFSGDQNDLPPSKKDAAQMLNVGTSSIDRAQKVVRQGVEGLRKLAEEDKVKVGMAAQVAELPKEAQEEIVARIDAGENPRSVVKGQARPSKSSAPQPRGNTPTYYNRSETLSRDGLITISSTLGGIATGVADIKSLPSDLTKDEARTFARDIRRSMNAIRNLVRLIEENQEEAA